MEIYSSIEEKDAFFKFGGSKIDNDKDFNAAVKHLMKMNSTGDFIFRGISEAKFQLFTTSQRYWEANAADKNDSEEYDNFIMKVIKKCKDWNNGTVLNLLKTYSISEKNSLAYLAFLQHYGAPTPLIDFTKNVSKAIFFAINDFGNFAQAADEIDNYFSIYFTYQNNTAYEVFHEVFQKSRKGEKHGEFDYINVSAHGIILLSDNNDELKILNNIRIANQEGMFFYNHSGIDPLEKVYKEFSNLLLEKIGREKFDEIYAHDHFAGCYNFHKKYAERMKEIVNNMGITKDFIYPDISQIRDFVLQ